MSKKKNTQNKRNNPNKRSNPNGNNKVSSSSVNNVNSNNTKNNSGNRPKVKQDDNRQSQLKSVKQTMDKIQSGNSKPKSKSQKSVEPVKSRVDIKAEDKKSDSAVDKKVNVAAGKEANVAVGKEEDIATGKKANVAVSRNADIATGKEADAGKFMDFSKIDEEYKGELRRTLTPKERFFRTCEKFGDLFLLNVFFTITSLPIVTIGASFTAMYTITFKMVRNEETTIKDGYFKAFKRNFKQSTQLWVGLLIVFYLIYLQLKNVMNTDSKAVNLMVFALGFQMLILTFIVPLLFPMVARYENTNFNMIKNSMLASFLHLGTWATVFSLWVIPIVLYYLRPTLCFYTWYLWFVFFAAFVAYTCSFRLRNMFDKIEEDPMEKAVEDIKQNDIRQNDIG